MKKESIILLFLFICFSTIGKAMVINTDTIQSQFNEDEYFSIVETVMIEKIREYNIEINNIFNRNEANIDKNMLLIPQFIITNNTSVEIKLDSINPINQAILFNKNEIMGTLLLAKEPDTIFCPKNFIGITCFVCGKYIYRETKYYKSLKNLLKKKPKFIFKSTEFERVWFYIDKNKKLMVFTYDLEAYSIKDLFNIKDLWKYSLPNEPILKYLK